MVRGIHKSMRRADRLLQIVQILRRNRRPVAAGTIASECEVSLRTLYRDMVALEASGVPVRGEAGVGYVLEGGYDLPPLMFNADEVEAIMLGARMVDGRADDALSCAARDVIAKIEAVLPPALAQSLIGTPLYAPVYEPEDPPAVDLGLIRQALREERQAHLVYADEQGQQTERTIWPVHMSFFRESIVIVGWCCLRQDFRMFRTDRMVTFEVLEARLPKRRAILHREWLATNNRPPNPAQKVRGVLLD